MTGLDFVTSVSGAATALANIGPGLGDTIGPAGNFATLNDTAKWLLTMAMLLGRLELLVVMVMFLPKILENVMTTRPLGAQISHMLKARGVDVIFGIPGVHNSEMYRGIEEAGITHVLARHEQGAGFMADGYARATGKPGVAYVITGPGLTNIMTPMGQAYSDSVPLLVISSCLDETAARRGQLHQMRDQEAAAATVCDWSETARTPDAAYHLIDRALTEFGRRGYGRNISRCRSPCWVRWRRLRPRVRMRPGSGAIAEMSADAAACSTRPPSASGFWRRGAAGAVEAMMQSSRVRPPSPPMPGAA